MRELKTVTKVPSVELIGQSDYSAQGAIEQLLKSQYQVLKIDKQFAENITWHITIDSRQAEQAITDVHELTHGAVELKMGKG
jgi:putative IMPACT (imprinted ancient) family translation regulator